LRGESHPRWLADRAIIEPTPEHKHISAAQHLAGRVLKVIAGRIQDRDVKRGLYKLQQRIALNDHVDAIAAIRLCDF